jgi:actin-related protein 6
LPPLSDEANSASDPVIPPPPLECLLVIDSGYSHTTITPLYNGTAIQRAIRRIDLGGKHLTNLLKEVVSLRYFDLHQDTKIVNDIKEDVCFVSSDYSTDMEQTWKGNSTTKRKSGLRSPAQLQDDEKGEEVMEIDNPSSTSPQNPNHNSSALVDYVLPDGFRITQGFSRPHDPLKRKRQRPTIEDPTSASTPDDEISMTLGSERFSIPEVLFTPSDIGSRQPGIPEAVMQSLSVLPPALQATFLSNILVVGGNARMKGFVQRIQQEVRMLAPTEYEVKVKVMEDPVTSTWLGGARMATNREAVRRIGVSKEEYAEFGSGWVGRRFAGAGR